MIIEPALWVVQPSGVMAKVPLTLLESRGSAEVCRTHWAAANPPTSRRAVSTHSCLGFIASLLSALPLSAGSWALQALIASIGSEDRPSTSERTVKFGARTYLWPPCNRYQTVTLALNAPLLHAQAPLLTVDREDLENAIHGRRVRQARDDGPRKKPSLKAGTMSLLTNPDVMIFFVMVTLMGFAKGVVDSFLFIFIDELGAQNAACQPSQWSLTSAAL